MLTCVRFSTVLVLAAFVFAGDGNAQSRTFGGYDCTDDCSGHKAGYEWAERNNVTDSSRCHIARNSVSFYEGCLAYTEDPYRGADEDDDGEEID